MTDLVKTVPQAQRHPKRWLLEEHLPGGSIRWHCFEHERASGTMSPMMIDTRPIQLALIALFTVTTVTSYVLFGKPVDDRMAKINQEVVHVARR